MMNSSKTKKPRLLLMGIVTAGLMLTASSAIAKTYKIWVDGLACPFCTYGIEKQLGKLPNVTSLKTSIKSGTVTIKTKNNKALTDAQLRGAVKRAGFTVRKIK